MNEGNSTATALCLLNPFVLFGATALPSACIPQLALAKTLPPGMRLAEVATKAGRVKGSLSRNLAE
jgi:hypothetical protein